MGAWRVDNRDLWDFYAFSLGFVAKEKRQPAVNSQTMLVMSALRSRVLPPCSPPEALRQCWQWLLDTSASTSCLGHTAFTSCCLVICADHACLLHLGIRMLGLSFSLSRALSWVGGLLSPHPAPVVSYLVNARLAVAVQRAGLHVLRHQPLSVQEV